MKNRIQTLNEQTWLIEEYDENVSVYMYLLEGENRALLIDTGFGIIPLKEICSNLTDRPITVVLTHGHADHIGGTGQFEEVMIAKSDEEVYRLHSTQEMRSIFVKEPFPPVKEAVAYLEEGSSIDLGDRVIEVIAVPGHSVGSLCFLDRKNRWLFTGDTCCRAHVLLQMEYAAPITKYRESIQKLLDLGQQYDMTWSAHHAIPVEKEVIRDFLTASDGIIKGTMEGTETELPMGRYNVLEYKEIGIEYH